MPDRPITFTDLVRGDITFAAESVPDYVLVRANGHPLYTLVNPVDDALMEITHVLRGEDLLSSTPRQIALYDALAEIGVGSGRTPEFGHLPYVMGQGNKKLSKRDPESNLLGYRERGFLPEGLLNYLALLGWAIAEDRDIFTMEEMVEAFRLERVNPNPARFDLKKAEAINAAHLRALPVADLTERMVPFLQAAGVLPGTLTEAQRTLLAQAAPLVRERMTTLADCVDMLGFLFVDDEAFERDPADVSTLLDANGRAVVTAAQEALATLDTWDTAAIEAALRGALVEDLGLKPRNAFGPVRVAVTGRRVSPPLFESMELLGRDRSTARLRTARQGSGGR
jgi:glutamyl-tRNA synthetase